MDNKSHRQKILENLDYIKNLFAVEGESLSEISRKTGIGRRALAGVLKGELGLSQATVRKPTNRIQDELLRCKPRLVEYCQNVEGRELPQICKELDIPYGILSTFRAVDKELDEVISKFTNKTTIKELKDLERATRESEWAKEMEDLEGEVWKDVVGYEGHYWISNKARIKNNIKLLKPSINPITGRYEIRLCRGGKNRMAKRYRLVAEAFIPNPNNLPTVNHKDGDITNDCLDNLEWQSYSEQNNHRLYELKRNVAKAYGKNGRFKKVIVDGVEFPTLRAACKFIGCSETQIQRYLSGETKTGYNIRLVY